MTLHFLCKIKGVTKGSYEYAGHDDIDGAVGELDRNGSDFVSCQELKYADVGDGGVFFDATKKVCEAWLTKYGAQADIVDGELDVPQIVKDQCPDFVAELEGEAMDWEAEIRAMNRDYHNSLGVGSAWR